MSEQKALRPRCGDSRCEDNLHCYHQARSRSQRRTKASTSGSGGSAALPASGESAEADTSTEGFPAGSCQACGAQLVPWERVRQRDLLDATHTFEQLKTELVRHHEFHEPVHQHAINYAKRKGKELLRAKVADHLRTSIGPAEPYHDGWQTRYPSADAPQGMDIIYSAQHATASCCRNCAERWHAIPQGRDLTDAELDYLTDLAMLFIKDRLPDLADDPEHVPPIRQSAKTSKRAKREKADGAR